jgi:hypothetical protein
MTFRELVEMQPTQEMRDWMDERTAIHIGLVQKYAEKLENYDPERFGGIIERCSEHDASKWKEPEYTPYCFIAWDYHCKDLGKSFSVPQEIKDQMNTASEHHIHSNSHHPEFYDKTSKINKDDRDKKPEKIVDASEMENLDIFEQLCDWEAMSEEKGNTTREWADKNVNIRWKFTPEQTKLIYDIIKIFEGMED